MTIRAKILLWEIWQDKLPWDEPFLSHFKDKWHTVLSDLLALPYLIILGVCFKPSYTSTVIPDPYVFCDANTKAMVYLCKDDQVSLVILKSRVVPVNTLPKLQLIAAVMTTRPAQLIRSAFIHQFPSIRIHLWSDSQIVLHWIHTKPLIANEFFDSDVSPVAKSNFFCWNFVLE